MVPLSFPLPPLHVGAEGQEGKEGKYKGILLFFSFPTLLSSLPLLLKAFPQTQARRKVGEETLLFLLASLLFRADRAGEGRN